MRGYYAPRWFCPVKLMRKIGYGYRMGGMLFHLLHKRVGWMPDPQEVPNVTEAEFCAELDAINNLPARV